MPHRWTLPTHTMQNPQKLAATFGYHRARQRLRAQAAPGQPFDFPAQRVGSTQDGNVTVYYDPSLGQPGADLAQQLLAIAAQTYANCQGYFNVPGQPINVIIAALNNQTDGSAGAYHYGCSFAPGGDLYCDAAFGNLQMTNGLVVAELTESFMGAQNGGWDCGGSNGEALSRFLAELESGGPDGVLSGYATGPAWDQAGRPDWIDATDPTDTQPISTGCGVVYLYWMLSQGYTAAQITQAGCPDGTLSSNYQALTGNGSAWGDFSTAVSGLAGIAGDNPWGPVAAHAAQATSGGQVVIDAGAKTITVPRGWKIVQR